MEAWPDEQDTPDARGGGPPEPDGQAGLLVARYDVFLRLSPRLAAAWRAFSAASPATRAEAEYELRCLEEEVAGPALTRLREAAEREACRRYLQRRRCYPAA